MQKSLYAVAFALLASAAACGSDAGTGAVAKVSTPVAIVVTTQPTATAAVGASAGTFAVKVVDAGGNGVSNVSVAFSVTGSATVSPAAALTDASGVASTQVMLSSIAGAVTVRATVANVSAAATSGIVAIAGATTRVVVSPKTIRLLAVGDTARVTASAQDQYGNAAANAVAYSVIDPTLVSVDQAGLVRALRQPGNTLVIASSAGRADTTAVTVLAAGASLCSGFATVANMNVNDVQTFSGTQYACLTGATAGAEYAVVTFNSQADASSWLTASVTGSGLAAAPVASTQLSATSATALRSVSGGAAAALPQMSEMFHQDLLDRASTRFRGKFARARAARAARTTSTSTLSASGLSASRSITPTPAGAGTTYSAIPSSAKVGDLLTLNVSAGICDAPIYHALRVKAIGTKSVILADTLNPTGGFTDADYSRFAARFDTLVYPLDVDAFGAPSDIDANGRVGVIFTRTVNELVNSTSGYFVGGFWNPRDIFPKKGATAAEDCAGSNEGEMFYMLVPAPGTGINGVTHTTGFVDSLTTGIIAHEFQHLISGSRRLYVNSGAEDFEDTWLNEGLSHIAEELLYYRETGFTPRMNLDDATIRVNNPPKYGYWKSDAASNFTRLLRFLQDPGNNSPYADDDELATRGAIWSFLRYAADRVGSTDGTLWQRFDNSVLQGQATLRQALGQDPAPLVRDWNVANYLDDYSSGNTDTRFMHRSWNFRSIYTTTFLNTPVFPLRVLSLTDNVKADVSVRGGSSSYLRLAVPAGKDALLTMSSGGATPSAPLQFVVVRTK